MAPRLVVRRDDALTHGGAALRVAVDDEQNVRLGRGVSVTTDEHNLEAVQFEHFFAGYRQFGMKPERVREVCTCGYVTRPLMTTAAGMTGLAVGEGGIL